VLDISIRLLVDDGKEGLVRSQAGCWMTIACLPLPAGAAKFKPTDPVFVNIVPDSKNDPSTALNVYGVRLTAFTPPLWCQFTQDASRFDITTTAGSRFHDCSVANLVVTLDKNKTPVFSVKSTDQPPQAAQSIKWLQPDASAQIGSVVAAIVTEFVSDAFDRVRERPVAVFRIDDGQPAIEQTTAGTAATMHLMWPIDSDQRKQLATAAPARVRLMSMAHLQLAPSTAPPASLADYFNEPFEETINMAASDAVGRVLSVSKPIDISS
jgi:hypothetical protein